MRHEQHEGNISVTQTAHLRQEWDLATPAPHEGNTNNPSAIQMLLQQDDCNTSEKINFDKDMSDNIFSDPYISCMTNKG